MIFELTVPFETNATNAKKRKQDRYATLISDLECTGYKAMLYTIEIGCRGLITEESQF